MATVEVATSVVAVTGAVDQPVTEPATVNEPAVDESKKPSKEKVVKSKKSTAPRKPSTHPPFFEMISDAIVTLKENSGSSQYAITKFIGDKHKQLPSNFRKLLLVQLKKNVAAGKLVKVKNSFKLPSTNATAPKPAKKGLTTKPKAAAKAPKSKQAKSAKASAKPKAAEKPNPKPKVAAKLKTAAKPKPSAKPKATAAKRKADSKTKAKTVDRSTKVAKISVRSSPGKKAPAAKKVKTAAPTKKMAAAPVKKVAAAPAKKASAKAAAAKKPKTVKSLAKSKTPARKAKK
ncbi:hypothetical protein Nepgr_015045 [Nepenthes gracilis]|uniref:H15 domain-containing protein n=1 Tax=Nepenthes gracilis TaxID=150966 RepID=A0AAD3SM82_NEPGR|nr:hypothetical protein Nepgr_015045 [Nepenthes gracilis]